MVTAGGGGFRGGAGSVGGTNADPTYDRGKLIYSGRSREARGLRICLAEFSEDGIETVATRISRSSLKTYKRKPAADFAKKLVDCEDASPAATKLPREGCSRADSLPEQAIQIEAGELGESLTSCARGGVMRVGPAGRK